MGGPRRDLAIESGEIASGVVAFGLWFERAAEGSVYQ